MLSCEFENPPNFFVIGAAKCASTSFCALLGEHPEVFMCKPKEPRFFSRDEEYSKGFQYYQTLFQAASGFKAVGEGSVCYGNPVGRSAVVDRVSDFQPDAKLIYMVRHPLKRIESDWKMRVHKGGDAVSSLKRTLYDYPDIFLHSLYWSQLNAWRQRIADEQILVIFFEDFVSDPRAELRRAFQHLGVSTEKMINDDAFRPRNSSSNYSRRATVATLLSSIPGFNSFSKRVPDRFKNMIRSRLVKPATYRADWDNESVEYATSKVKADCSKLLEYVGRPVDYWEYGNV